MPKAVLDTTVLVSALLKRQDKGCPLPASDADPRRTIKEGMPVKLARV